jgi:hypothetical protein
MPRVRKPSYPRYSRLPLKTWCGESLAQGKLATREVRVRSWSILVAVLAVAGCGNGDDGAPSGSDTGDCPDPVAVFTDQDHDGVGDAAAGVACGAGPGQSLLTGDCNDAEAAIHPGQVEGCNGLDDDCDGTIDQGLETHLFYQDLDRDTWGTETVPLVACHAPSPDWTRAGGDCDDTNADVNPGATEICGGGDEDCDGLVDQDDPSLDASTRTAWYPDRDADGFGAIGDAVVACVSPQAAFIDVGGDCNDEEATINPNATEVCGGTDEDCDGLRNDADPSVDPAGLLPFFADTDRDGFGDPGVVVMLCGARPGAGVDNDLDCDDTLPTVAPGRPEVLCDGLDDDCDPTTADDADADVDGFLACGGDCNDAVATIHPGAPELPADAVDEDCDGFEACFVDADGDGARGTTPILVVNDPHCTRLNHLPPSVPTDCDDMDPAIDWSGDWWTDGDGDGYGDGVVAVHSCVDQGAPYVLASARVDCDDGSPSVFPGAPDACNDGVDADCDASDDCATCWDWHASDAGLGDGVYSIRPDAVTAVDVWCDMTTDGGGWTLVASTASEPPSDAAGPYNTGLTTLSNPGKHAGVWDGLRGQLAQSSDLRFTCKDDLNDQDFAVDLSFYDVPWYGGITVGTDAQSCFSVMGNPDPPPARRNNLTGDTLPVGDPYNSGALEGEDSCADVGDFTIDFDDRGMDGNGSDGTDWGMADGKKRCGQSDVGDGWFIFAR